jgi:hypothetical protein
MPLTFLRNLGIVSAAGITTTKLGAGAVLQVVTATYSTDSSTTSNTFVATGLSASITPSSASNKILVITSMSFDNQVANADNDAISIFRGVTNLGQASFGFGIYKAESGAIIHTIQSPSVLDSPSTTSATTYAVYAKGLGLRWNPGDAKGSIILMEIAG